MVAPLALGAAAVPPKYLALGAGAVVLAAVAWISLRRRAAESIAKTVGRELGAGAVELVGGVVGGVKDAAVGVVESVAGVTPFTIHAVPGREFSATQTNLQRLQGRILKDGLKDGEWTLEVQNTGNANLGAVRIELVLDKLGLDPVHELVGQVDIPARSGVRATGRVLVRSMSGFVPLSARLMANKYLLAKAGEGGGWD